MVWKEIVTYGFGADKSLHRCLSWYKIGYSKSRFCCYKRSLGWNLEKHRQGTTLERRVSRCRYWLSCLFVSVFSFSHRKRDHCNLTLPRKSFLHQHHNGLIRVLYPILYDQQQISPYAIIIKTECSRQQLIFFIFQQLLPTTLEANNENLKFDLGV